MSKHGIHAEGGFAKKSLALFVAGVLALSLTFTAGSSVNTAFAEEGETATDETTNETEMGLAWGPDYITNWGAIAVTNVSMWEGHTVPVTIEGDSSAISYANGFESNGDGSENFISLEAGEITLEGEGTLYQQDDNFSSDSVAQTVLGGWPNHLIPIVVPEGKTLTSVTLVVNSVNSNGYVTSLTVRPVYATDSSSDTSGNTSGDSSSSSSATASVDFADSTTGVKASGTLSGSNIPEGATVALSATPLTSGDAYDKLLNAGAQSEFGVYEITMTVDGKEVSDGFGTLTLSFPVDEQYNGYWFTIYHLHDDGTLETQRVVAANGYVTFDVTSLSTFSLQLGEKYQAATDGESTALAKTGDSSAAAVALFAVVAAASVAVVALRRQTRNN